MSTGLVVQGETFKALKEQADIMMKSNFLPKHIKTPEQAIAIAITGVEAGLPMMQAFKQIFIGPDGKPSIDSHGHHFLIRKNCPGAVIDILELTDTACKIWAKRPNHKGNEFTFTIEDAKRAQLLANNTWQKYPKNMLFARCISNVAKMMFPDCVAGISYTHEELGRNIPTDEEGNIIDIVIPEEKYDENNVEHKRLLASVANTADVEKLRELSKTCIGLPLNSLREKFNAAR